MLVCDPGAARSDPSRFSFSSAMSSRHRVAWPPAACTASNRQPSIRRSRPELGTKRSFPQIWGLTLGIRHRSPPFHLWRPDLPEASRLSRADPGRLSRTEPSRLSRTAPGRAEPVLAAAPSQLILHWDPGAIFTIFCGSLKIGVAEPTEYEPITVDEGIDPFVRHSE